ncbi:MULTISPECIES: ComEC/Rec2 family competence protein [unclassified Xanthobacter]|uniref:ComEC/Rec2 family competence protein n=1 Tax=unclassified Xanthobacter TaxID=2623496 RepID=UPI001EDD1B8C|nr:MULTISPECIES: ComEC/Rec2 family competence protein [unclassified Xanthobacter]
MGAGPDHSTRTRPASSRAAVGTLAPTAGRLWTSGRAGELPARLAHSLFAALVREAGSGRLVLWLPVAFTVGVLLYFGASHEPSLVAAAILVALLAAAAVAARRHPLAFALATAALAVSLGFLAGVVRTAAILHVPVAPPSHAVRLTGYVEQVERRPKSDRILLRLDPGPVKGLATPPELVRLSLRKGTAPKVGDHVSQLARLLPPLEAAQPGAHDFGRAPWFRGIGAIGFGLGRPQLLPGADPPLSVRLAMIVSDVRAAFARRIDASLQGTPAAIAVALVAGDRTAIAPQVEESMRVSGLTHILSISGLHMALVAGTLFALARGALALVPGLALRWPIKGTAALMALVGSAGYLILSGNEVPAQRSFVMTALVLGGVLVGRRALTLRTVAVAALLVLGLTPEAVLEPGTQMSFAATLALVAAYERFQPLRAMPQPESRTGRLAMAPLVFLAGIAVTSLVAGLASGPYGAYHFQRVAPYGLLANLLAMPAVSLLVMPFGLVGVLLMPFGWDQLAWPVMGKGIEIMVGVSDWIASLPGADSRFDGVRTATVVWFTLALLTLCLLRGMLSLIAAPLLALAVASSGPRPRPDVLIATNAATVAVRGPDGRLAILGASRARLVAEQWLEREGDPRTARDRDLARFYRCDGLGCTAPLPQGGTIAVSTTPQSLAADCMNARIVVTRDTPPAGCPARVLTPESLAATGTLTFHVEDGQLREVPTRSPQYDRPWTRTAVPFPDPSRAPQTPAPADRSADDAAEE